MMSITQPHPEKTLTRQTPFGLTIAQALLMAITLLALALHILNLGSIGDANTYYTAAVESMLQSWENFFFVAAEPGGSVSVDKPPLGLWIEAAFAFIFGVSGVVVSMPNIIAGVLSVPLLYHLVRKHWGEMSGLIAGFVLAVTPVFLSTNRNNTMDGMLVFTLLLAAWSFIKATETGKTRWLMLGAAIVGLGFNIKMLQAFLPLPALYGLYLLGSKHTWPKKIIQLFFASIVLLIFSLSWAIIVDLTPSSERPFVGSSDDNTVMELIIGHNGLSRLLNPRAESGGTAATQGRPQKGNQISPGGNTSSRVPLDRPPQVYAPPDRSRPAQGGFADGPRVSPDGPQSGDTPFSHETGSPGVLRFFTAPLSKQMSWLLPFALVSMLVLVFASRFSLPLDTNHQALVLWGGWLLVCLIFFSAVEGIFHAYYAIMLAPPLGALVGGGFARMAKWSRKQGWGSVLLFAAVVLTIAFQVFSAYQYGIRSAWIFTSAALIVVGATLFLIRRLRSAALIGILSSMLIIPLVWSILTVMSETPNVNLPTAYEGTFTNSPGAPQKAQPRSREVDHSSLVTYLEENTPDTEYLVAVPSAQIGAPLVLETGRPVLYMGGFNGSDPVIDAQGLSDLVAAGEVRYVLLGGQNRGQTEISEWVASTCTAVPQFSRAQAGSGTRQRPAADGPVPIAMQPPILYRCDPE